LGFGHFCRPALAPIDPAATVDAFPMSAPVVISILLVCDGPEPQLPVTLTSLREQRWLQPEVLLIDRSNGQLVAEGSGLRVVPAAGRSRADALNDGIAAAQGEWLLFLRPGDRLVGDMVLSETHNWMKKTESGVVAGEVATDDGEILRLHAHVNAAAGNFLPASGTFYRATLFAENGGFDPDFDAAVFYELNVRLWKSRVRFKPLPLRIAAAPARSNRGTSWAALREEREVRRRYFHFGRRLPWNVLAAAGGLWRHGTRMFRR
jgi:hypothetical protein